MDWKIREGYLQGMLNHTLPLTLGWDVSGEVAAVGAEVTHLKLGDAVYSRPDIAKNGSYGKWRSKADPKTYTYRGKSQIKALELLGIKL